MTGLYSQPVLARSAIVGTDPLLTTTSPSIHDKASPGNGLGSCAQDKFWYDLPGTSVRLVRVICLIFEPGCDQVDELGLDANPADLNSEACAIINRLMTGRQRFNAILLINDIWY
jgi:hypothetical protein